MKIVKALLLILSTFIFANEGNCQLEGKIIDAGNGDPLIGANVLVLGSYNGTVTDFDGNYTLEYDGDFPVTLEFSYLGYNSDTIVINTNEFITVKLAEQTQVIAGVEVVGQRISDKQKAAPLTVESLDALAIKATASNDFYSGLGSLKGVDLTTASLGFTVVNTRGFNSTSPVRSLQIIDGVDNQSPGLNFSLGNFLGASELDIQKVDLVVGASSAFYGPNAFNGVISMETKDPFFHKGLSGSLKVAERNLFNGAFRYANALQNSEGNDFFAYKLNFSYLTADDWVADNYDPITDYDGNRVFEANENPGGADAVNIYGDEYRAEFASLYDARAGLNSFNRRGYKEEDLVDYNTENLKAGVAFHFRTKPSLKYDSPEILVTSNFGYGTTVYQGDNRFSLRGIQFFQQKLEFRKKDKFFIRAYATNEDAGDSYDPYFTAIKLQERANDNENWVNNYTQWWSRNSLGAVFNKMKALGYPQESQEEQIAWQREYSDSLMHWHNLASQYADSGLGLQADGAFLEPGTPEFQAAFDDITSKKNNATEDGTRFFDKSALYHAHGEYKFESDFFKELVFGSSARLYRPNTEGTIFSDSIDRISNFEYGVYGGASKAINDFTLSAALRVDKNQNFKFLVSPAGSIVYNPSKNNYLRLSFSSAIRNPTLSDQYLDLEVGPAKLIGNLTGFDDLVTFESFNVWRSDITKPLIKRKIDPIRPENVRTMEIGYRTSLFENLFLDASYYYNIYNDFIGFQVGLNIPFDTVDVFGTNVLFPRYNDIQVFRVAANSDEVVTSQGFALGYNYYFSKYYSFNGNYSYNALNTQSDDPIVPAFNTPKHKYNLSITARDIPMGNSQNKLGFNVNYKWIQGFIFEGSPQFTGFIPSYDMLDAQVSYTVEKIHTTFKLGASNLLDNRQFQTYGGPRIGRMAYLSATYDFKEKI